MEEKLNFDEGSWQLSWPQGARAPKKETKKHTWTGKEKLNLNLLSVNILPEHPTLDPHPQAWIKSKLGRWLGDFKWPLLKTLGTLLKVICRWHGYRTQNWVSQGRGTLSTARCLSSRFLLAGFKCFSSCLHVPRSALTGIFDYRWTVVKKEGSTWCSYASIATYTQQCKAEHVFCCDLWHQGRCFSTVLFSLDLRFSSSSWSPHCLHAHRSVALRLHSHPHIVRTNTTAHASRKLYFSHHFGPDTSTRTAK